MSILISALSSSLLIAILSMIGVLTLAVKERLLRKILIYLVSFSAGALLGGAFFHLLPEAIEEFGEPTRIFSFTLIGLCLFFVLEKFLRWRHCHGENCEAHHHIGYLNLIGDAVHNLIDGIVLVSAFLVNPIFGWSILIPIAMHEIPQEIGDFGVLLYAGFKKSKALAYNFLSAMTIVIGVIVGYVLFNSIENLNNFLLPFAAGGFMYIAGTGLIPELHKITSIKKSFLIFVFFLLALGLMYWLAG